MQLRSVFLVTFICALATLAHRCGAEAHFYLDLVEAENSIGLHAPEEALPILRESINFARQGLGLQPAPQHFAAETAGAASAP